MTNIITAETRKKLKKAQNMCDSEGKSTEFMLQYMQDFAGVDLDTVMDFLKEQALPVDQDEGTLLVKRGVIPPEEGWKENTYYIVDVAFNRHNPVHKAIFFTGFLNGRDGGPGGYNQLFNPSWEGHQELGDMYYVKAVELLENVTQHMEPEDVEETDEDDS